MSQAPADDGSVAWWVPGWREAFRAQHGAHATAARAPRFAFGGNRRADGGGVSRFIGTSNHADRAAAALPAGHAALREARTLFPTTVVAPSQAPRVLVSGHNSAKIGRVVQKGAWAGLPIFTLTLQERATCPAACPLWAECYGNAMPLARRHGHGTELVAALDAELAALALRHARGFVVRLHVLGDFYSADYVAAWTRWLDLLPGLRVFGYTAHSAGSPIGRALAAANVRFSRRCAIRFSISADAKPEPMQATTIWRQPAARRVPEGIVCPAQTGATAACATCGLCWAEPAKRQRIVFVGHGMNRFARKRSA